MDQCARDSDCTQGKNGRCLPQSRINAHFCSYDVCSTDSECSSDKVCQCGKASVPTRAGNACLPGNCHTDGDCGAGGYCSPSLDKTCGSYIGVVGYYCHTPNDECTRDDQCSGGFCAFDPTVSKWACQHSVCAG